MNDESRRILRCDECKEGDEMLTRYEGKPKFFPCTHRYACKRAYRLGAADVREAMQDDGR